MKQAIILAAGEGQRLRPFTVTKPKVMLSIADKPILQYVVESLAQNGIHNITIVVGYRREQIFDYMGAGEQFGVSIDYIIQDRQLGTAHALAQSKDNVEGEFLLLPGDNLIEADTIAKFATMKPSAVLVKKVKKADNTARYGVVTTEGGHVKNIAEKPQEAKSDIISTGIYSLNKDVFNFLDIELDIPAVLNDMIAKGHIITAQETEGTWFDVVYPWDILTINDSILHRISANVGGIIETGASIKGLVSVGNDTIIRSNSYIVGPVVIGRNCDIGPNVCILPATSIGDNVIVSSSGEIKNSVISNDVNIGSGSMIHDSVIDEGCIIKGHFTAGSGETEVKINNEYHKVNIGTMLGVGCSVGNNVVAQPGVIIGNYSQIQSMKLVSGKLPDKSLVL